MIPMGHVSIASLCLPVLAVIILGSASIHLSICTKTQELVTINVVRPGSESPRGRFRRSSHTGPSDENPPTDPQLLPNTYQIELYLSGKLRRIFVVMNPVISGRIPVYFYDLHVGEIIHVEHDDDGHEMGERGSFYQDQDCGTSVHILCENDDESQESQGGCYVTGTLCDRGDAWNLRPAGRTQDGIQHLATPVETDQSDNESQGNYQAFPLQEEIEKGLKLDSDSTPERNKTSSGDSFLDDLSQTVRNAGIGNGFEKLPKNVRQKLKLAHEAMKSGKVQKRPKRDMTQGLSEDPKFVIELLLWADDSVFNFFKEKASDPTDMEIIADQISLYYSLLINEMDLSFQTLKAYDSELDLRLHINGILVARNEPEALWASMGRHLGEEYLDLIGSVQMLVFANVLLQTAGNFKYDHIMAFTKRELAFRDRNMWNFYNPFLYGVSIFGMCLPALSVSLIQDTGTFVSRTGTRELAKSMGILPDGASGCLDQASFIMSSKSFDVDHPLRHSWRFSSCSAAQVLRGIKKLEENGCPLCFAQHHFDESSYKDARELPPFGEVYSFNETCQFYFGHNATFYEDMDQSQICNGLRCSLYSDGDRIVETPTGAPCGNDKMCYRGECVPLYQVYPEERCRQKRCCGRYRCCMPMFLPWGVDSSCCRDDKGTCCVDKRDVTIIC